MRRLVLIVIAVAVIAGGAFAIRGWLRVRDRQAKIDAILQSAQEHMKSEQGLSQAAVELKQALEIDPDHVATLVLRGDVCLRLARYDDAIVHLQRAAEIAEGADRAEAELLLGHAFAERYRGTNKDLDFRSARTAFIEARGDAAREAEAMHGLGALYLVKGRFFDVDKGLDTLEELLKKHPDYRDAAAIRDLLDHLGRKAGASGGG